MDDKTKTNQDKAAINSIPHIFNVYDITYVIFEHMGHTADLKNVSLTCRVLNAAVRHRLFRFMTLPGAAMGLRDPKHYNILKGLYPANGFQRVSDALSSARSLKVSRRLIASAIPFTAPQPLRDGWGLDDLEFLGQCHEIYEATGIILSHATQLQHLEFTGFHLWLNVLKLLHMREIKEGFCSIESIEITRPGKLIDALIFTENGELHSCVFVRKMALILISNPKT